MKMYITCNILYSFLIDNLCKVDSKFGKYATKSIRWGVSPYYADKYIRNTTLRRINQSLRDTKLPIDNWRTADKGHLHWKWRDEKRGEWFWLRK